MNVTSGGFKSSSQLSNYQNPFNNIYNVVDEINEGKTNESHLKIIATDEPVKVTKLPY